nr:hypothetical protein [Photobacterium phosphoreum]
MPTLRAKSSMTNMSYIVPCCRPSTIATMVLAMHKGQCKTDTWRINDFYHQ